MSPSPIPPEPGAAQASPAAFDARAFRTALGSFGTGVTVITAATQDGRRAALTVNSFASVSLAPPLVLWSLGLHSASLSVFQDASHFAVNVLGEDQADLARHFARSQPDKFAGIDWRPGLGGAPILPGTLAEFECRNANRYYGGDHIIFLGAVEAFASRPGAPLLFCQGQFGVFAAKG